MKKYTVKWTNGLCSKQPVLFVENIINTPQPISHENEKLIKPTTPKTGEHVEIIYLDPQGYNFRLQNVRFPDGVGGSVPGVIKLMITDYVIN